MMQLEACGVTAGYGPRTVLHDITLNCRTGAFVGLIGPNGCGKSTLLRALSGVLPVGQGTVLLEGRPLKDLSFGEIARRIAFVPQEEKAAFEFSVQDVVLMGRFPHRSRWRGPSPEDYMAVERALIAADILHLKARLITRLSGGERRRVLLARALAQQTPLLLLDEPTAHLDITHQAALLQLAQDLAHPGDTCNPAKAMPIGVLAALHDLNQAAEYCDHLILMHQGRIVAQGAPEEVLVPARLRAVYDADAQIGRNPITGRPMLLALRPVPRASTDNSVENDFKSKP